MEHEIKSWPGNFEPVLAGLKNFEIRFNDRNYQVGDTLRIREWDALHEDYTGRVLVTSPILYISNGFPFVSLDGYLILSFDRSRLEPG